MQTDECTKTHFNLLRLPEEIILTIFHEFIDDLSTLGAISLVNRRCYELTRDSSLMGPSKLALEALFLKKSKLSFLVKFFKKKNPFLKSPQAKGLRFLNLRKQAISKVIISQVTTYFPKLERLNLSETNITADECKMLHKLTRLQRLNISHNLPIKKAIDNVGFIESLTSLDISSNWLHHRSYYNPLKQLTRLTHLNASENWAEDAIVYSIAKLLNLQSLNLSKNNLTDDCVGTFITMTQLKSLNLSNNCISSDETKRIQCYLSHLENLDVSDNCSGSPIFTFYSEPLCLTSSHIFSVSYNIPD